MVGNFRELRTRIFDLLVLTALSAMVIFPALARTDSGSAVRSAMPRLSVKWLKTAII